MTAAFVRPLGRLAATLRARLVALDRRDVRAALGLVLLVLGLWLPRLRGPIDLRWDAGVYYVLGTSLAKGEGYRLLNEPGAPEGVQYPPLLPAFVAAHQLALGTHDPDAVGRALRVSFLLLSLAYVLAIFVAARRFLSTGPAAFAAALTWLHFFSFFLTDALFTEVPFALLLVLFLLAHERSARRDDRGPWFAAAALLAAALFLLRTSGLAVLVAWPAEALTRRRVGAALRRAVVVAAPVLAWQAHVASVQASPAWRDPAYAYQLAPYQHYNVPYVDNVLLADPFRPELGRADAGELVRRVALNVAAVPRSLGESVSTTTDWWTWMLDKAQRRALGRAIAPGSLALLPLLLLGVNVLLGLVGLARRGERLVPLVVGASVGLICLTPWPEEFARYLAPLTPCLAIALTAQLTTLPRSPRSRRAGVAVAVLAALTAVAAEVGGVVRSFKYRQEVGRTLDLAGGPPRTPEQLNARTGPRLFWYDGSWAAFDACLAWLRLHAAPDAVVASAAPHRCHLLTDLASVIPPMEPDPAQALRLLDSASVDYLIIDELSFRNFVRRYASPVVEAHPGAWRRVYTAPGMRTAVYRRASAEDARR